MRLTLILGLALPAMLSGCGGPSISERPVALGSRIITSDAAARVGFVQRDGKNLQFCFQPEPDATRDKEGGFSLGFSLIDASKEGGGGSEHASVEDEMAGRSPGVLFAREAFYRLCEMEVSTGASQERWEDLFLKTLDHVTEVLKIEAGNSKTEEPRAAPAELPTMVLPQSRPPSHD